MSELRAMFREARKRTGSADGGVRVVAKRIGESIPETTRILETISGERGLSRELSTNVRSNRGRRSRRAAA
jgi:hypothetical protein